MLLPFIWIHDEFFVLFKLHYIIIFYRDILGLNHHVFRPRRTATSNFLCCFMQFAANSVPFNELKARFKTISLLVYLSCYSLLLFFLLSLTLSLSLSFFHSFCSSFLISSSFFTDFNSQRWTMQTMCSTSSGSSLLWNVLCDLTLIRPGFVLYNVSCC